MGDHALAARLRDIGRSARAAARGLARATREEKDRALLAAAHAIEADAEAILAANAADIAAAPGLAPAFLDRMTLTHARIEAIAAALRDVAALPDPVGQTLKAWTRPNGLRFARVAVPIGVLAVIYESRPNVTADAAALAIKSGNAVILRGGSETIATSRRLAAAMRKGLAAAGLPEDAVQFIDAADRTAVGHLLAGLDGAIDLIVPRGGRSLVERVAREARVAVLGHMEGLCHVYVDRDAAPETARAITLNAKMRRTGVCGAAETLLVDRAGLERLLPPIAAALAAAGCELRGDAAVRAVVPGMATASAEDWSTEYLAPILSIAAVDGVEGAIAHIARYGTGHTDAIVTENAETAERFLAAVDSAIVLHNASTQFADGAEFGFGAEIGIATGRLHARGPVGVAELTTYKTIVRGTGQVRP